MRYELCVMGWAEARFLIPVDYAAEAWQRMPDEMREIAASLYERTRRALPGC